MVVSTDTGTDTETRDAEEAGAVAEEDRPDPPGSVRRWPRIVAAVLAVALLATGGVLFAEGRALRDTPATSNRALTDSEATTRVAGDVSNALGKVFSYSPQATAVTKESAKQLLAGKALQQYAALFGQVEKQAADQKLTLTTHVVRAGVTRLTDDSAHLLVFLDQVYEREGKPPPRRRPSSPSPPNCGTATGPWSRSPPDSSTHTRATRYGSAGRGETAMTRVRKTGNPLAAAAVVLAVAAAGAAAWGGVSWYDAAHDESAQYAQSRDEALAAGEQAVQNMNTLDHRKLEKGLDTWEDSTTGDLHQQLVDGRSAFVKQIQQAKTVSTAQILSGAVTELDDRAGKAGVMVALRVTVTVPKGKPAVKESRMLGKLTRTSEGWKLSALGQAPVGNTAG